MATTNWAQRYGPFYGPRTRESYEIHYRANRYTQEFSWLRELDDDQLERLLQWQVLHQLSADEYPDRESREWRRLMGTQTKAELQQDIDDAMDELIPKMLARTWGWALAVAGLGLVALSPFLFLVLPWYFGAVALLLAAAAGAGSVILLRIAYDDAKGIRVARKRVRTAKTAQMDNNLKDAGLKA